MVSGWSGWGSVAPALAAAVLSCQSQQPNPSSASASAAVSAPPATLASAATASAPSRSAAAPCDGPGQCMVMAKGCCPPCQNSPLVSFAAYDQALWQQHLDDCQRAQRGCAKCADHGANPNFIAWCQERRCTIADIRQTTFSACTKDSDCVLTQPSCCGCSEHPVAIGQTGAKSFRLAMCDPETHCSPCPRGPADAPMSAVCRHGHCETKGVWKPPFRLGP